MAGKAIVVGVGVVVAARLWGPVASFNLDLRDSGRNLLRWHSLVGNLAISVLGGFLVICVWACGTGVVIGVCTGAMILAGCNNRFA